MSESVVDYDVIVVGGRPAGASLAARLGQQGLRVLLLERSTLPSLPGASSPIIYGSAMRLLDEIGADEAEYARNTPQLKRMINVTPDFHTVMPVPMVHGRDYAYGIDRARFDYAIWQAALRQPTVDGQDGTSVIDLHWEDGRVAGAVIQDADKVRCTIRARIVVGADGRFSTVARKVGAQSRDHYEDNPTSLLYAYWQGAQPWQDGLPAAIAYSEGTGFGFLMMESADDSVLVAIEGRADLLESGGKAEQHYIDLIRSAPPIWSRLQSAHMITGVHGMRKVGNLYREPGGPGWALVGDAYHQKDPIDGQGIFDALMTARLLAEAIGRWQTGRMTWEAALAWYDAAARAETMPMYKATLERVRSALYAEVPAWVPKQASQTLLRWLMEDRLVQEDLGAMLVRQLDPRHVMSAPVVIGALMRGPLRDLSRRLDSELARIPTRR